jgi:replicative DNA helicase
MTDIIRAVPSSAAPGRVPPQSLEAEMAVLGAVLLDNNAFSIATESISHAAFYKKAHADIFAAMEGLAARGEAIDVVTLSEELKQRGTYQSIGGAPYLTQIMDNVHTAANVEHYAGIVLEKFVMRKLITICSDVTTQCYAGEREAADVLDEAERHIFEISQQGMFKGFESIGKIIRDHFKNIEALYQSGSHISGLATPFEDLDSLTSGFQKSDLIIIAGRPGMGKTSFALNLGQYLALKEKIPVGVFSLEMSAEQLVTRLLCSEARVDSNKLRRGYLKSNEYAELAIVAGYLAEAPIFIDDSAGLSTLELRAKARRLKAEHNVGMIIIDYLQLVSVKERVENRQQQISLISRSLKALAKELGIPVVALSQLSRAVESRGGDKRPMLSDLRESGCLSGESLVTIADTGARVPIRDLVGTSDFDVWAVNTENWKLEKARASRAFSTGVKPVFKLRTQLGRTIRATANHRFLTINGWKRLDDLKVSEHLALPRHVIQYATREHRRLHQDLGMAYSGTTTFRQNMGRSRAVAVGEVVSSEPLARPAGGDVYWDRIASIEPDGVEEVFDLTIPGPHNFVANDMIVHNSIEQDADVVLFLYRPEVYDSSDENRGKAELIIGKQRNGPTGTVNLTFIDSCTRFEPAAFGD